MPLTRQRSLIESIRRWRIVFVSALLATGLLAIGTFVAEHFSTVKALESGEVIRRIGVANHAAWDAESAVRKHILDLDPSARRQYDRVWMALVAELATIETLVKDNATQSQRVHELRASMDRWQEVFGRAAFEGTGTTREIAVAGTVEFDVASGIFDDLIAEETRQRVARIDRLRTVRRTGLALMLLALGSSALAFAKLARGLAATARLTETQYRQSQEQAAELEQQTGQLQDQAGILEEQASELEQRLTEREETARLLERTATFLDSALESAPIGIAFYDRQLRFQRVNEAMSRINGVPAEAHIGRSIEDVIPALAPTIRPLMERVFATGKPEADVLIEGATAAFNGASRRWMVTYYPIASAGHEALGVGAMVLDITERSQLEEQLRQAQKMEAVGRLAGGIAHDFNNILTIIQSYAEILIGALEPGAPWRVEVEAIRGAADRATALSRQLLSFSRRQVIIPRDLDLNVVVRGMESIVRRLLRQGMEIEFEYHREPLMVRVDAGQLEQVLMNLAINGVDAMPNGGTLRVVTSRRGEMPRLEGTTAIDCAVLAVQDTGSGMTKEVQERLFEPFFTTKPAGQGTGLGLATTYAIVRDAGGVIRVDSTLGEGSEFDVYFPISTIPPDEPARGTDPDTGAYDRPATERLLLAEDEPAIRQALARVLRTHGYEVIEAANGGEALRLAEAEPGRIHLLLTDVMMPGIGGRELAERLSAERPGLRVILMSGYTDDESLRAEIGDDRHVFLQKPFAARVVVEAVRTLLDAT